MNRRNVFLLILPVCAATMLQAQLKAPKVGIARYPDGSVHSISGLPANYIVDPLVLGSSNAASFSDAGGLIAQNGRILLLNGALKTIAEYDSSEQTPLVNLDGDLRSAVAWLPSRQALLRWTGASFVTMEVSGARTLGQVTSVRLSQPDTAKLLVTDGNGSVSEASISLSEGEVTAVNILPGVRGPAFRQHSFVVFPDEHGIEIATSTAIVRTVPLTGTEVPRDLTFERMSADSLHLFSPGMQQSWVLILRDDGAIHLSRLPEPPARAARKLPVSAEEAQN